MTRLKYCPDLIKRVDTHRAIAMSARLRRHRRCVNVLFLAAAVTTLFAPLLLNTDVDNVSFIGLSDQKVEHLIADDSVSDIKRKTMVPVLAGYIGKTNSVMSSALTPADVSYSGSWAWVDDGNGNYRIRFLTSGTFVSAKSIIIDVFLVGGGASGGNTADNSYVSGSGGGGGYTGTWRNIALNANQAYTIVVGAGAGTGTHAAGGSSWIEGLYGVSGGQVNVDNKYGGAGGSGGGSTGSGASYPPGAGGTDGSDGGAAYGRAGGVGQHTTTREFGEAGGYIYSGGGGAAKSGDLGPGSPTGAGGVNGGGAGANVQGGGNPGAANTGAGGGGAMAGYDGAWLGGAGGSGIVIIRNKRA